MRARQVRPTGASGALPDRPPHRHARRPTFRQAWKHTPDLAKAGFFEHGLGAEEREIVVHAFATGPRIRLDGGRAALPGVINSGPDHRERDTLTAIAAPHRDARDHPGGDVVDGRCRLRILDPRVVVART
jgi:hypothetical protein